MTPAKIVADERVGSSRWFAVGATAVGLVLCGATFGVSTFGVLTSYLRADLGWAQQAMVPAFSVFLISRVIMAPVCGWLVDRFGSRRVALCGILAFALTLFSGAWLHGSVSSLYIFYFFIGVVGGFSNPVVYVRAISLLFEKQRGFALGVAVAGQGAGATILPKIMSLLAESYGWRMSLEVFAGALIFVVFPVVAIFMQDGDGRSHEAGASDAPLFEQPAGLTVAEASKTRAFWIMVVSFGLFGLASYGFLGEFIYLLTKVDGVRVADGAIMMGTIGLTTVLGRSLFGYMMDRWHAPKVGAAGTLFFAAGVLMILLIHGFGPLAILCAAFLGLSFGSETDLLTLLVSRYFGNRNVGQIYGWQSMAYTAAGAVGPILFAFGLSYLGGYAVMLWVFAAIATAAGGMFLLLGPYPAFAVDARPNEAANFPIP